MLINIFEYHHQNVMKTIFVLSWLLNSDVLKKKYLNLLGIIFDDMLKIISHNLTNLKIIKLCFLLFVILLLSICISFAKDRCWINKYGNKWCTFNDGRGFYYVNKQVPWNPYYWLPFYVWTNVKSTVTTTYKYNKTDLIILADRYCKQVAWKYSYYEKSADSCFCNDWYVVLNWKCVLTSTYCKTTYWTNSYYNKDDDSCKCSKGYIINSKLKCVPYDSRCKELMWNNGYYNTTEQNCRCKNWYILDEDYTCTLWKTYCTNTHWKNSYYDSNVKYCLCKDWYVVNTDGICVLEKSYCWLNEQYNPLTAWCSCKDWYVKSDWKCVLWDDYCKTKVWPSTYLFGWCYCDDWYIMINNKCISWDKYCKDQFWEHSFYTIKDSSCYCEKWYHKNYNWKKCVKFW